MTAYLFTIHLLNFIMPAAVVALLLMLLAQFMGRFFRRKRPATHSWPIQLALIFSVNLVILLMGLLLFGNDGKMFTYAALVLGSAVAHWVLGRGWQN